MSFAENTSKTWRAAPDRFLNEEEISQITGLAVSTHQKLRLKRRGPRWVRLGRSIRYSLWDVQDWLARQPRIGEEA